MPHATDKFRLLTPFGSLFDNATLGIAIYEAYKQINIKNGN
jgi:hypothetical protein